MLDNKSDKKKGNSWFRSILLYISVTDPDFMEKSPKRDLLIQEIKGIAILITSILAFFSGTYAIYTVFENWIISVIVGIVWGAAIMNIDRLLITSFSASSTAPIEKKIFSNFITPFLLRLPIAGILGLIISVPLELRMFHPEIEYSILEKKESKVILLEKKIEEEKKEARDKLIREVEEEHASNIERLTNREKELLKTLKDYKPTMITSSKTHDSIITVEKRPYPSKLPRLIQESLISLEKDIAEAQEKYSNAINLDSIELRLKPLYEEINEKYEFARKLEEKPITSLASRYQTLEELREHNPSINKMAWGIRVLIVLMEIMPVLIKTLSKKNQYDRLINHFDEKESEKLENSTIR